MALFEDPLINTLILIGSLVFLGKASDLTITNSVNIADVTGFGKTTVGFILVAFSTSLPELLVSVFAVIASYFIVDSASFIAGYIGIPRVVIGATIIAFGTSLPELVTSVSATRKGHLELALGNIVGSCFINITCILGVSLVASPLNINMAAFSNVAMFSLITNLFLWYFLSSEKISWREGTVLLFIYAMFLTISFGGYKP